MRVVYVCFFFKQKTAYELRISDWSSDVCSSDLVDLVVRGACALRAGVPGLSDNITVKSIVGKFLEHSRVFYFYSDGAENVYLSSADWMDRNFFRRVEVGFPILDKAWKIRVINEALTYVLLYNPWACRALPYDSAAQGH